MFTIGDLRNYTISEYTGYLFLNGILRWFIACFFEKGQEVLREKGQNPKGENRANLLLFRVLGARKFVF